MTQIETNVGRRERAIERASYQTETETLAIRRGIDAYRAELAADLENDETVQRFCTRVWGCPQYPDGELFAAMRAALKTLLEER